MSGVENQRWWAGIIGAVRGGLGLFTLFALLLALFAGAVVFSNTSEPAKLWILAVVGVFWVGNTVLPFVILYGRPSHLADQVDLRRVEAELYERQSQSEYPEDLRRQRQRSRLETSEGEHGNR